MRNQSAVRALLVGSCAAFAMSVAFAADVDKTVQQKDGWASYAKQLAQKVESVNSKCGSSFTASYDKSTYAEFDPIKDRT